VNAVRDGTFRRAGKCVHIYTQAFALFVRRRDRTEDAERV